MAGIVPDVRVSRPDKASRLWLALAGMASVASVAGGFSILLRYQWQPGPSASVPERWPDAETLTLDSHQPTLLVFAHPQCPCTRATIGELDRIAARCRGRLQIVAIFLAEPALGEGWSRSDLWNETARIPGVEVRADPGGALAHRFGIRTSGHVLLYSTGGRLLFEGGITDSRGHAGDNPGESAVVSWVLEGASTCVSMPVYGCLLESELSEQDAGGRP